MPPAAPSSPSPEKDKDKAAPARRPPAAIVWMIGLLLLLLVIVASQWTSADRTEINYSVFEAQIQARNVKSLEVYEGYAYGEFKEIPTIAPPPTEIKPPADEKSPDQKPQTTLPPRVGKKFVVTLPA